jgi:hypothetical protein
MVSPTSSFFIDGPAEDSGYVNVRDRADCSKYRKFVEQLWQRYYTLADTNFRTNARDDFLQRFWEMYLAVVLMERGFNLNRGEEEGPEFFVMVGSKKIWFEAIAPESGNGPDKVPNDNVYGEVYSVPTEKILLRFTNALDEKRKKYKIALDKGIISNEDQYVLAINSRGIPNGWLGNSLLYYVQAFLPIGPLTYEIDKNTNAITDKYYQYSPEISKLNGSSVSTNSFLDLNASFCSAVIHSHADCTINLNRLGDEFSVLHNPKAGRPLNMSVFEWCEQFTYHDNQLHRTGGLPQNNY